MQTIPSKASQQRELLDSNRHPNLWDNQSWTSVLRKSLVPNLWTEHIEQSSLGSWWMWSKMPVLLPKDPSLAWRSTSSTKINEVPLCILEQWAQPERCHMLTANVSLPQTKLEQRIQLERSTQSSKQLRLLAHSTLGKSKFCLWREAWLLKEQRKDCEWS